MLSDLPPGLADFLRDHVSSYEELNALLLMSRSPLRIWSSADVAESLNAPEDVVEIALEALVAAGIVIGAGAAGSETYQYAPQSSSIADHVTALERAYVDQPMAVVQIMTTNAIERVRSSAARRLADAFRFERWKK